MILPALLAIAALRCAATELPDCFHKPGQPTELRDDLGDVFACQQKARRDAAASWGGAQTVLYSEFPVDLAHPAPGGYRAMAQPREETAPIVRRSWSGALPASEAHLPPAAYHGPTNPPILVDFADEFMAAVRPYLKAHARKKDGAFVIQDAVAGRWWALKLLRLDGDHLQLSADQSQAKGCLEFVSLSGAKARLDVDFFLRKDEEAGWRVREVRIHGVDGRSRFLASSPAAIPKPSAPARLSASIVLAPDFHGLVAGDEARVSVTVANAGPGPAYAVRILPAVQAPGAGVQAPSYVEIGDIAAGKSLTRDLVLSGDADLKAGRASVRLEVKEGNGFDADPVVVEFETRSFQPPALRVAGVTVGGGGVVRVNEAVPISVTVANEGSGPAGGVVATLEPGSPDIFLSGDVSIALGGLEPGQTKAADFEFFINKRYRGDGYLPLSLTLTEARGRYEARRLPLNLRVGRSASTVQVVQAPAGGPRTGPEPVDFPPKARMPVDPEAYAVVVGVERYRDVPPAEFAARDAQAVYAYLTQAMGFDLKNVVLLENERAGLADLSTYLGPWLRDRATAGGRVFVYFSGHGAPNPATGEAYLVPFDGDPTYADSRDLALKDLYATLGRLPTKDVVVVLDSCFSGAGGRSLVASGARPLVSIAGPAPAANTTVLAAASGGQISTDDPEAGHGLLTYFLLKGLRGAAARSGTVTTQALFDYVKGNVERAARERHVQQTPVLELPAGGGRGGRVWLRLP